MARALLAATFASGHRGLDSTMRFVPFAFVSAVAAIGCEQRAPHPAAPPVASNAALSPGSAAAPAARQQPSSDRVEIEFDLDEDEVEPGREAHHAEAAEPSGEPMDDVDDGTDLSGAPERAVAFDDPAASDSEASDREEAGDREVVAEQPARR